jgi:hypothetical protein
MKQLVMSLCFFGLFAQTPADKVREMTSPQQAPALSRSLLETSRQSITQIAALLNSNNEIDRANARAVLNYLEELALPALAETKGLRPEDEVWRVRTMAEIAIDVRQLAARAIDAQLRNCSIVPADPRAVSEVNEGRRRVCDDAYLAMMELIGGKSVAARDLAAARFLGAPEERRDAQIRISRQAPAWRELIR